MKNLGIIRTLLFLVILLLSTRLFDIYMSDKNIDEIIISKTHAEEPEESNSHGHESEDEKVVSVEQIRSLSDEDIDILKRLNERKKKLLAWEDELRVKHNVLSLTEEKIDKKLEALRVLKKKVESALQEYRKEEDKKTQSLVKIYENMKPKNAADIMARMKLENILPIVDKMKEKNAAEILAKMDPQVAKSITSKLAEIGRLED